MVWGKLLNTTCCFNDNNGLAGAARKCLPADMLVSMGVISSLRVRVISLIMGVVSCIVSIAAAGMSICRVITEGVTGFVSVMIGVSVGVRVAVGVFVYVGVMGGISVGRVIGSGMGIKRSPPVIPI